MYMKTIFLILLISIALILIYQSSEVGDKGVERNTFKTGMVNITIQYTEKTMI